MSSHLISDWANWNDNITGDGVLSISGSVLTASASAGANSGYKQRRITVRPGDIVTLRCSAKTITTSGETEAPRIAINYNSTTTVATHSGVLSDDWAQYECSYQIPLNAPDPSYARLIAGVYTDLDGEAKFTNPTVEVQNSGFGTPRVMAWGLLKFDNGVLTVVTDFVRGGVASGGYSYNAGTKIGTLTVPKADGFSKPLFFIHQYAESGKNWRPMVKTYDEAAGTVQLNWYDMTGTLVDISATSSLYCSFMMVC